VNREKWFCALQLKTGGEKKVSAIQPVAMDEIIFMQIFKIVIGRCYVNVEKNKLVGQSANNYFAVIQSADCGPSILQSLIFPAVK